MGNFRENTYVLMMGYRQELAKALEKYKVKYSIVTNKPLKKRPKHVDQIILSEFNEEVVSEIAELKIKPTHVIAGVEAAVYPASRIRKHFMARLSEDTLVRRCSNKAEMKYYLWQKQIPMTSFVLSKPNLSSDEIIENLSLPVVVKKILGSGGRDLVLCKNKDALT